MTLSKYYFLILTVFFLILIAGCKEEDFGPQDEIDIGKVYIPNDLKSMDLEDSTSAWYWGRSRQSEHFIVFWDRKYGNREPGSGQVPASYRVDIDDLLNKAEQFFEVNVTKLRFAELGVGKSNLDKYKIMIFLFYQDEWLATGSGYDNEIGALWISPNTSQPAGQTIAHEIGHSFQYQIYCDNGGTGGFRYGFGGNGGNGFWEQTAQWQSFQSYPEQMFGNDINVYADNYHRHICHEWQRYASYWIHNYWAEKHGPDIIARIWKEAIEPEDPMQAYMRITGISEEEFNDEIYEASARFSTWDLDAIRSYGSDYIGIQTYAYDRLEDGSYQVAYEKCPGTTGYNVIPLNVPETASSVFVNFTGLLNEPGYNPMSDPDNAGWRYGFVALLEDGTRVYSESHTDIVKLVEFEVPENTEKLWFIVTGAPKSYNPHPWDDIESNDEQWPYKVKFQNTDILGNVTFDGTEVPQDISLEYDISFPLDNVNYSGSSVRVEAEDLMNLAQAFVLQPSEISEKIGGEIKFYAVESDGSLNGNTTANGYGHWFDSAGNVVPWGSEAKIYSEFNETGWVFNIGQYPGHSVQGDKYTVKQVLEYEHEVGSFVRATFTFNVTID